MLAISVCSARDAAEAEPTVADRLFKALEERRITAGPDGRLVEVLGIHAMPDGAWVQIALAGEYTQGLILHLARWTSIEHAIAALKVWGETPIDNRPRLIHVMSRA